MAISSNSTFDFCNWGFPVRRKLCPYLSRTFISDGSRVPNEIYTLQNGLPNAEFIEKFFVPARESQFLLDGKVALCAHCGITFGRNHGGHHHINRPIAYCASCTENIASEYVKPMQPSIQQKKPSASAIDFSAKPAGPFFHAVRPPPLKKQVLPDPIINAFSFPFSFVPLHGQNSPLWSIGKSSASLTKKSLTKRAHRS